MKRGIRILAVDDAPFDKWSDRSTFLVGLLFRELTLEVALREIIRVDGDDSTSALIKMVRHPKVREEVRVVLTHGTTFAGLNLLDMRSFYEETGIPLIAVTSREPTDEIRAALRAAGQKWKEIILERNPSYIALETAHGTCYYSCLGLERDEVERLVRRYSLESKLPEQLRVTDLVARLLEGLTPKLFIDERDHQES